MIGPVCNFRDCGRTMIPAGKMKDGTPVYICPTHDRAESGR